MRGSLFFLAVAYLFVANGQKIDSILQKHYENKEFAGIVAGISVDGKIIQKGSSGYASLSDSIKLRPDMFMRIASIIKPMTAVAVMQLIEKGKLKLDEPISTYISEFKEGNKSKVTVRQVLSHTSGIPGYKNKKEKENKKNYETLEAAFAIFKERPLDFEPGSKYSYTSYGYVVLGILIERLSGLSYQEYMQKNLWKPAGMGKTQIENQELPPNEKSALYHKEKGKIKQAKFTNLSDRIPGGGIHSSLSDLLHFGNAMLKNKLITDSTFQKMLVDPGLKKVGNGYGLGFTLYGNNPDLGPVIGHAGGQTGCSAILFILPEKNATICVISNTSGANGEIGQIAIELFELLK